MASSEGIPDAGYRQLLSVFSDWYDQLGYISMLKVLYSDHVTNTHHLNNAVGTMELMDLLITSGDLHQNDLSLLYETIKATRTFGLEHKIRHHMPSCPNIRNVIISKFTMYRQRVIRLGMALITEDIERISRLYNNPVKKYADTWCLIMDLEHRLILNEENMEGFINNLMQNGLVKAAKALTEGVKVTLKRKRDSSDDEDQPHPKYVINLLYKVCQYKGTLHVRDMPECSVLIREIVRYYSTYGLTLEEIETGSIVFHLSALDSTVLENLWRIYLSDQLIKGLAEVLVPKKHHQEFFDEWMTYIDETEYNMALRKLKDTEKSLEAESTSKNIKDTSVQLSRCLDVEHDVGSDLEKREADSTSKMFKGTYRELSEILDIKYDMESDENRETDSISKKFKGTSRQWSKDLHVSYVESDDDFCFGQREPPLVDYVKQILRNYTEGQILKELTQNADDAGATTVRFLYDGRQHGTKNLYRGDGVGDLSPFQGPALCAYNDANFMDKDWISIQNLSRSEKKDDPTKVGRFGMGFVSVYHMTDMPSIVSGNYLAFMDPTETLFVYKGIVRRGRQLDILKRARDFKDPKFSDQFQPYKKLFRDQPGLIEGQFFRGTMFRFPLRRKPSVVSDNVLNGDGVRMLFDLFVDDAKILLLFLKTISSITVGERLTDGEVPLFSASISCSTKDVVQKSREDIVTAIRKSKQLQNIDEFSKIFPMDIEVVENGSTPTEYHWMISIYLGGSDISPELLTLAKEHDRLPLVGVAMQAFSIEKRVGVSSPLKGRTCCFLPLPPSENNSGLPVHVNADFGVSDDRRSIKWPVEDRNDKMSKWNKLLLQHFFPKAYTRLILHAIEQYSTGEVSVDCIYQTWPDVDKVKFPWKDLMCPELFNILLKEDVFFSEIGGGKWININEAIFYHPEDTPMRTAEFIVRLLLESNVPIVSSRNHPHVMKAIETYSDCQIKWITPSLVRSTLRNVNLSNLDRSKKITLLEYLLDDENNFADLYNFELLPLADGSFCRFASGMATNPIFFSASHECSMELLPGLRYRFLTEEIEISLRMKIITGSKKTGINQIQELTPYLVATLIRKALPSDWSTSFDVLWYPGHNGHPPRCWLEKFWNFLHRVCKHSKYDISMYEGITLIPTSFGPGITEIKLVKLVQNSNIVVFSGDQEFSLDPRVEAILPCLHLTRVYLENAEFVTFRQPDIWKMYLHKPDPNDILRIFADAGTGQILQSDVRCLTSDQVKVFRKFLGDLRSMTPSQTQVLLGIAVFEVATSNIGCQNNSLFQPAVINSNKLRTVSKDVLPNFPTEEIFIDISDEDCRSLASILSLQSCPREEVLCQMIRCTSKVNRDLMPLIIWIMDRWDEFQPLKKPLLINEIRNQPFIPLLNGRYGRASECFDPSDEILIELFSGRMDIFPASPFESNYRSILLELGLKTRFQVKEDEVRQCVTDVILKSNVRKGYALLKFLDENPGLLTGSLCSYLNNQRWVPVEHLIESDLYPSEYPRYNICYNLLKPNEVKSVVLAPLVASTMPLVSNKYQRLTYTFKWELESHLLPENVYTHLKNLIDFVSHRKNTSNRLDTSIVEKILHRIYIYMQNNLEYFASFKNLDDRLIWTGTCFVRPSRISIRTTRYSLEPYAFVLHPGFSNYKRLFKAFGAIEKFDDKTEPMLELFEEIKTFHEPPGNLGVRSERMEHDRDLAIQVIECIIDLNKDNMTDDIRDRIFLPVAVQNKNCLQFASCNDVCYPNEEWLEFDEFEDIKLVHEKVSRKIYNSLDVTPLGQKISGAMSLLGFQQAGQKEDLTQKLRNILDSGYTENSIANEMIQNADDAGASEVRFMIDMRTNNSLKSRLLDKGMESWQGPALWVYNDSTFSDADFENITKIGGRTKGNNPELIGKFGLGFNSVYHITDVPSFLSRGLVGFLDPHTIFLDSQLRDKRNPGIRIDLNRSKTTLKRFRNQFQPFHNVFGCNLFNTDEVNFGGALFRLPLRTSAIKSQISDKHFEEDDVLHLMENVNKNAEKLLLFTQHVTKVSVYYLGENREPQQAVQLFSATKTPKQYIKEINSSMKYLPDMEKFKMQNSILFESSQILSNNSSNFPSSLTRLVIEHCVTNEGALRYRTDLAGNYATEWLVFSCMGQSNSLKLYKSDTSRYKIPCGGVALPLLPQPVQGEVFCFLPLSIPTSGIPLHINGNFEVSSDRRNLWRRGTLFGVSDLKADWNDAIFADIISRSYVSLLSHRQAQRCLTTCSTYDLWPNESQISMQSEYLPLLKAFYKAIVYGIDNSGEKPCVFQKYDKWLNIDEIVIYKPHTQAVANDVKKVLQRFIASGIYVVDIPENIIKGFERADCGDAMQKRIYNEERFFKEIFFPNINDVEIEVRDKLTMHIIDQYKQPSYRELLDNRACIPTGCPSIPLKKISDMVHPYGKVSALFEPEEYRFLLTNYQHDETRMEVMVELGMKKNDLSLPELIERARILERCHKIEKTQRFMEFLETKCGMLNQKFIDELRCIEMIPVSKRPTDFPADFPWFGDNCGDFLCATDLYPFAYTNSVCFVKPIVHEQVFRWCRNAENVSRIFNLSKQMRAPSCIEVTQQLKKLTDISNEHLLANEATVLKMCKNIYSVLERELDCNIKCIDKLRTADWAWVWHGEGFACTDSVCISKGTVNLKPYFYSVHQSLRCYKQLFMHCNIPQKQSERVSDLIGILHKIKKKHDKNMPPTAEVERDRSLVIEILNVIKRRRTKFDAKYSKDILLPIECGEALRLVTPEECCFSDDWFKSSLSSEPHENIVHQDVTNTVAEFFGVTPLSIKLSHSYEIGITQFGQEEPLTQRLHNILQDYQAIDIPKEMIQNADDARATEVKFLLDLSSTSNTHGLLDKEMAQCHGPALCVFNNAMFTENDFENIIKLGGQTKLQEIEKIGKFGLGFNAVYHITDVPSFISNGRLTIFDPHRFHLKNHIRSGAPGIQMNFRDNPSVLDRFSNQFLPYENVFGCDLRGNSFTGTLFRLPLRTANQVRDCGKISRDIFDEQKITNLITKFQNQVGEILIFTKHVKKMSIYRRNGYDDEPTCICSVIREPIIERCIENINKIRINMKFLNTKSEQADWIIKIVQGNKEALQIARSSHGVKHGLNSSGGLAYKCCSKKTVSGLVFCFLPLSIPPSGLPIHINAKFSVTPDRRSLRKKGSGDDTTLHSEWNNALMKDVIARGYVMLLSEPMTRTMILTDVTTIQKKDGMFSLWPRTDCVHTDIVHVVHSFYQAVVHGINQGNETDLPQIFNVGQHWYTFSEINFLDADLKCCPILTKIKDILIKQGFVVIDLPDYIQKSFVDSECFEDIRIKTFSHQQFFEEQFFPRITELPVDVVNVVVLYLLQHNDRFEWINEKLKSIPCIPSTPDGARKVSSDLIDHTCYKIASMYLPEDGKFPLGKAFRAPEIIGKLRSLGMAHSSIPFEHVIERCQSIELILETSSSNEIIEICQNRANAILLYIESINKVDGSFRERIQDLHHIKFIPVETHPPKDYPVTWANTKDLFLSPHCVYSSRVKEYVGAVAPVTKELKCSVVTDMLLKIKVYPDLADVIEQLKHLIATEISNIGRVFKMYNVLMEEIKKNMNTKSVDIKEALQNLQVVFCSGKFVKIENVTLICKREFQPYLYRLPTELRTFCNIFAMLGMKEDFSASTLLDIIYFLKDKYNENALNKEDFYVAIDLVHSFAAHKTCDDERQMLIPDSHRRLRPANELSFCLHDSSDDEIEGEILCHELIPHPVAERLGVKDIRLNILSRNEIKFEFGTKFGQVQKLTSRIREILEGYPCDEAILKELLQNADDAGADEINFIYDPRQHPDEKVFCESWKQTLGPALCVFNNKPFTECDLKGIQDLGIGSKSTHSDKTGQYGIGFNSVYHLTDCPAFLSNDDTLCIFDPRCAFIEYATVDSPGFQYDISPKFNKLFRDALSCFRLDSLPNTGCTMFRFPLRTANVSSYANFKNRESVISQKVFDGKELQKLLNIFKLKAFDMLLYLNNVNKITISHIHESQHKMNTDYSVKAELSKEDEQKRHEFYSYVKKCSKKTKLEDIKVKEITYEIKISDNCGKTEVWLVNQRIGSAGEIPIKLSSRYKEGHFKLLPRGGVAARLRESENRDSFCTYCFLPIPIYTNLPVSVNGHFSLDRSRRNLSNTLQNLNWNLFVMIEVISYSYTQLLRCLQNRKFGPVNDRKSQISCTSHGLQKILDSYWRYFPNIHTVHSDWKPLAEHVFRNVLCKQMPMFPVVQRRDDMIDYNLDDHCVNQYTLEWHTATGVRSRKAYFYNENNPVLYELYSTWKETEKKNMLLKAILQHIGFSITIVPKCIYQNLTAAGEILIKCAEKKNEVTESQSHGIELVSPDTVVHFLKTDFNPGPIPCHVSKSRLQCELNYFILLNYIDSSGKLKDGSMPLEGLPLLLTQDSWIRKFNSTDLYFLSKKHALLPKCLSEFVHENAQYHFSDNSFQLKHLGISDFVERLQLNLDLQYNACDKVPWDPNSDVIPNKAWIQTLWNFLKEEFAKLECRDDRCAYVKRLMGNWAVIPVKVTLQTSDVCHYLMPFSSADLVLHSDINDVHIRDAFSKMELPVVDCTVFQGAQSLYPYLVGSQSNILEFVERFIATAGTPERILTILVSLLIKNDKAFDILNLQDKKNILLYFVRFIGFCLNQKHREDLMMLPCYLSIYGKLIRLDRNKQHFVLYSGIPEVEREKWITKTNAEFIKEDSSLTKLHTLLGLTTSTELDVYKQFILPAFDKFTHEARVEHLTQIQVLLPSSNFKTHRDDMISNMDLKNTPLVSHEGQPIRCISDFFDSCIPLFKCMLEPEMFLPKPYCDVHWKEFMRDLGLKTEPTPDDILEFARRIESDMVQHNLKAQTEKSKTLINYIAMSEKLKKNNTDLIRNLRSIAFLAPQTLHKDLLMLHKQYNDKKYPSDKIGIAYDGALTAANEYLVWTSANLLPHYAVPCISSEGIKINNLLPELNASETPSVEIVLRHIRNLCTNLKDEYSPTKKSVSRAKSVACKDMLHRVMNAIYEFLCEKLEDPALSEEIVRGLNDETIMLVDNDDHLIKTKYTVKSIKKEIDLKPYIFEIPECFLPYMGLFSRLGAQHRPSIWQCCELLAMIHSDIEDKTFLDNPRLMLMIKFAVHKIFESYQKKENWLTDINILYLPNRSFQLIKSINLKYYDKPMFEVRMKEQNDKNVLIDLNKMELENDVTEYIQNMPIHLQPCKFSKEVQEIMSTKPDEYICRYAKEGICEQLNFIQRQLHSIEFRNGIYRLMKHEANKKGLKLPEHIQSDVSTLSRDHLSIQCLNNLETHLVKSDEVIEGSTLEELCFLVRETTGEHAHKTIFIRHQDSGKYDLLNLTLAGIISELNGKLINDEITVAMMIVCDLSKIQTLLNKRNILRSGAKASEHMSLPDL